MIDLESVVGLSAREAAKVLGVGKTTVAKYRKLQESGEELPGEAAGTVTLNIATTAPVSLPEALADLRARGVNPDDHNVSIGFTERLNATGVKSYGYTARAVPKKPTLTPKLDADELVKAIENYNFTPFIQGASVNEESFIICPSDMQIGKTSFNGGTDGTIERVLASFEKAADFCEELQPRNILIAELGDPLENFYSTSSQRETNDLDLTGQLRVARRLLLEGIKILSPYAPRIKYAAVPSNHGSVRVGFKAPAGDNHNDFGLEIAAMIEDAVRENPSLDHVSFHIPDHYYESMLIEVSGTKLGLVHGHQAGKAESIGTWWGKQVHGRQPTADADILLAGHFHSFRVYQSGAAKWVMVSPAQDPGSDWFTNITGEHSDTGMLSFTTKDGKWNNLRIL